MEAVVAGTRQSTTCKRCGRIIRRVPAGRIFRWVNLSGTGWRCRPTAKDPDQAHVPVEVLAG